MLAHSSTDDILAEIAAERVRQKKKWGQQNHRDGTGGPGSKHLADPVRGRDCAVG